MGVILTAGNTIKVSLGVNEQSCVKSARIHLAVRFNEATSPRY